MSTTGEWVATMTKARSTTPNNVLVFTPAAVEV